MLDVSICLGVLILMLPVMGLCSLLIWLDDPGPILFRQWRTGLAGRRFRIYKFRTMKTNAEELKAKYAHLNESKWPDFKMANDPRVTRIGYWLRKASLDELPQLFNVLKGDMSLVGPRPTSFDVTTYALWYTERLEVLPGITGLAQVNGRADLDFDQPPSLGHCLHRTPQLLVGSRHPQPDNPDRVQTTRRVLTTVEPPAGGGPDSNAMRGGAVKRLRLWCVLMVAWVFLVSAADEFHGLVPMSELTDEYALAVTLVLLSIPQLQRLPLPWLAIFPLGLFVAGKAGLGGPWAAIVSRRRW